MRRQVFGQLAGLGLQVSEGAHHAFHLRPKLALHLRYLLSKHFKLFPLLLTLVIDQLGALLNLFCKFGLCLRRFGIHFRCRLVVALPVNSSNDTND